MSTSCLALIELLAAMSILPDAISKASFEINPQTLMQGI
jgi:hypothetical protein